MEYKDYNYDAYGNYTCCKIKIPQVNNTVTLPVNPQLDNMKKKSNDVNQIITPVPITNYAQAGCNLCS